MLVVRMFSSPICRVRVAKPRDEAERVAEIGGPLELELVDRRPWAYHAHSSVLVLCQDDPPASCWGGGVGSASLLFLLHVILPGKPEVPCLRPSSRRSRGMVSEQQLYK